VHSDPWAYLKVDIRVKKEKMVVKVKSKTCANGFAASLLASIYHEYKDNDGFLYISYSGEKTFG
jgi:hypothetical protein